MRSFAKTKKHGILTNILVYLECYEIQQTAIYEFADHQGPLDGSA